MRKAVYSGLITLRSSSLRRPLLALLVKLHNFSYHAISFLSSYTGKHPKHDILNYHQFFVDNTQPTDAVLDIGCGKGEVAASLSKKARHVVGIDISAPSIAVAEQHYRFPNLTFLTGNALTYHFAEPFDVIILSNVLEHIEHRVDFLKKIRTVAPKILIRVPMITRDWISMYKKREGFEYRLDDTHFIEYDIETFMHEMRAAGLVVRQYHINFGELYAVAERLES